MKFQAVIALLMCLLYAPDSGAQTNHRQNKITRPKRKTALGDTVKHAPLITVDTQALKAPIAAGIQTAGDTAKKDTTIIEQVADAVHDTVKAQLKAPIVQVPVKLKTLIIPGALFAYGCITLNNGGLKVFNEETREVFWDGQKHDRPYIEDYLLLVPAAAVYGLNFAGVKGRNNFIDRSVIYGMSNLIANGFVFGLKNVGIETRPDSSDNHSFPSGHTAEAFVSAEFLHQEYKGRVNWTVIAGGYAVATGVAYLRMAHNKHWLSDVVAGAGIGMASTRFSYYLYPILKHALFGSKKVRESAMIMPSYQPGGIYGLNLVYKF